MLSLGDFAKTLSHVPTDVRIDFSGFSEPFLNPQAVDMVELAHDRGYDVSVISTLVGLKPSDVDRLARVDTAGFVIHFPDPFGIARIPMTEEYKEVLSLTLRKIHVLDMAIMNRYFVDHYWAGNSENAPPFHFRGPFLCPTLSGPKFVMLPDGTTVLCHMDIGLRHVLGNLMETSYDGLMESKTYRRILRSRLAWNGSELCRSCRFPYTTRSTLSTIRRKVRKGLDLT
ncbi:MAG TPA: SPASM domain-containing protein [Conexivisphaerales archaeon]|nr:SPASM domain-containing protein [Conexivisphaerales archaeon]